nr:hypothetical protein [Tanacetum cinerariifolium]
MAADYLVSSSNPGLALVVSHAEVAPETYWKYVLPNTPMPKVSLNFCIMVSLISFSYVIRIAMVSLIYYILFDEKRIEDKTADFHVGECGSSTVKSVGESDATGSRNQFKYDAQVLSFFLERDIYQGHGLKSYFPKENNPSTFLPCKVAETIPFSSNNLPELLDTQMPER